MNTESSSDDTFRAYERAPVVRDQWHFVDYLRLLSKRRWTAIPAFLTVVVGVAIMTYTAVPIYEARTQLLIEAETQNIVTFKEVVEQEMSTIEYYTTQYKILQSRALARTTIDRLKLWNHPELSGRPPAEAAGQQAGAKEAPQGFSFARMMTGSLRATEQWVQRVLGPERADAIQDAPKTSEMKEADESAFQTRAIEGFLARLTITPVRNSRLVDVKFQSTDPALAASIANTLAQAYVDRILQFKMSASKEASDWLSNQLSEQKAKVEQSEQAVQRYREQNSALAAENPEVAQKLNDLSTMVTRAKTDRLQKELLLVQVKGAQGNRAALLSLPSVASNPNVQRLTTELSDLRRQETQMSRDFGDRWPEMIKVRTLIEAAEAKLVAEGQNVVALVQNEVEAAKANEESLVRALESQKAEAMARDRKNIGFQSLEREAVSNRQIFDTLMQRAKETNISSQLRTNNIRVADEADPPSSPMWPNKSRNLLFAIFAGAVLAVGLAFSAEYLDNKLKSPEEIRDELGLRCLGLVPKIGGKENGNPMLNNGVPQMFAEAFRTVRTNVLFSFEDIRPGPGGGRSVVVTSTAPGEGKTLVASNLAAGLALAGQRVILIDGDMRRPRVHEIFQRPQEPGLSNVVLGTIKASQGLQPTDIPGLWLLPAGALPPNPAELLSSPRFRELVNALLNQADWVVIDSPPTMAVIDASVLAHIAGGVLFVVSAEKTSRPAATKALEQLDAARPHFLGAVLNRVDVRRNAFFYSPYYRREYSDYYSRTAAGE